MADISITAANVVAGSDVLTERLTAGAALTAGQVIYKDASDSNKAKLTDVDSATVAAREADGIALNNCASGQPVVVARLDGGGLVTIGGTVTPGVAYYASDTAGGICVFADLETSDWCTIIGIGYSATQIRLCKVRQGVAL
jgi:hypothetical protein